MLASRDIARLRVSIASRSMLEIALARLWLVIQRLYCLVRYLPFASQRSKNFSSGSPAPARG